MSSRRLVSPFDEVGEAIGIVGGQGVELVEERLLRLQLLAKREAWVAVHEYLQPARARDEYLQPVLARDTLAELRS